MKKNPICYCLKKADDNVHKLYLYDDVTKYGKFNWETWSYDDSETSAAHFRELLNEIPETDTIELHFNTNGGSVSEGTSIYNLLKQHGAKKIGVVDGVCHSIGLTILQACDERRMGDGTSALLHNMWMSVSGNAKDLRDAADRLDAYMESCIALYMKRCTINEEELRQLMDAETVLTPQKALEYGFIDEIGVVEGERSQEQIMQMLLKENAELKAEMKNNDFNQRELKEFLMTTKPASKPDPTGLQAFFNGKGGNR